MKLAIITNVQHRRNKGYIGGYGPYVWEMNLWLKHADSVKVVAPMEFTDFDPIDLAYEHSDLDVIAVPAFDITTAVSTFRALFILPLVMFRIFQAMCWADHIHIRCPGNMGLLACILQVLLPGKAKSVKYAANWDLSFPKPWSYRIQQRIAMNPRLSRNMQVMVYGEWPECTKNIVNFFTATYAEHEAVPSEPRPLGGQLRLIFVARLVDGKRPLVAAEVVKSLVNEGHDVVLDIYGDGPERDSIERFVFENRLGNAIRIHGNVDKEILKQAYQCAHFLVFPTVAEGWGKAVAEAMFWGCVPITTEVSCLPYIIGYGARGATVIPTSSSIVSTIKSYLREPKFYAESALSAMSWSRQFTLESFESEIVKLLQRGIRSV